MTDATGRADLAVTGATGRLGGRVARRLADAGVPQTLLARDPARAPQLLRALTARASYADAGSVRAALAGARTVFMVSAAEAPDRVDQHRTFIDAAVGAGITHLVYTSFVGAGAAATFTLARDHGATEAHIRTSGVPFTFLRDNLYADFLEAMVGADGIIRGPAGDGRAAVVTQDDVADVATAVLLDPGAHAGATYELTGPAALTLGEATAALTAATGRAVGYHPETLDEAYASRASHGAPDWQVDAWVSTYTAIAAGELARVSGAVEAVTGHPATSFAELLDRAGRR